MSTGSDDKIDEALDVIYAVDQITFDALKGDPMLNIPPEQKMMAVVESFIAQLKTITTEQLCVDSTAYSGRMKTVLPKVFGDETEGIGDS